MHMQFLIRLGVLVLVAGLAACSSAPAQRQAVYDFGPGATRAEPFNRMAPQAPVLLADVEAASALEGTAVLYRLDYADAQQLHPYAQARWTMAPAQLLRQRLREMLGRNRTVLSAVDAVAPGTLVLRVELEEFSQLFDTAQSSAGLVRLRATLSRSGSPPRHLAQTGFVVQRAALSADAAGGVKAMAAASDAAVQQLEQWLQQVAAADTATQ